VGINLCPLPTLCGHGSHSVHLCLAYLVCLSLCCHERESINAYNNKPIKYFGLSKFDFQKLHISVCTTIRTSSMYICEYWHPSNLPPFCVTIGAMTVSLPQKKKCISVAPGISTYRELGRNPNSLGSSNRQLQRSLRELRTR
jgi:hypothetical protein